MENTEIFSYFTSFSSIKKRSDGIWYVMSSTFLSSIKDEKLIELFQGRELIEKFEQFLPWLLKMYWKHYIIIVDHIPHNEYDLPFNPMDPNIDNIRRVYVLSLTYKDFFNPNILNNLLFKINKDHFPKNIIFLFRRTNWFSLITFFMLRGISISGGVLTKRHLLSPHQIRLSTFLSILYAYLGEDILYHSHNSLFNKEIFDYKLNQPKIDLSSKDGENYLKNLLKENKFLIEGWSKEDHLKWFKKPNFEKLDDVKKDIIKNKIF